MYFLTLLKHIYIFVKISVWKNRIGITIIHIIMYYGKYLPLISDRLASFPLTFFFGLFTALVGMLHLLTDEKRLTLLKLVSIFV